MNIQSSIDRFTRHCVEEENVCPDNGELLEELDLLLVRTKIGDFPYDENDYPDAPSPNYKQLRERISMKFPRLGLYCTVDGEPETIDNAEVLVGDAVDDLTDIVKDLQEVQWYFENTSSNNALWHLQFSFRNHWGLHARELQLHLHKYCW